MNSRQVITTIIVIAALAAAGVFGYMSLVADPVAEGTEPTVTVNQILPEGTSLNFDKVNEFNETGRKFQYPAVTPADAGLQLNEIMQQ